MTRRWLFLLFILGGLAACAMTPGPPTEQDYPPWNYEETFSSTGRYQLILTENQTIGIYWGAPSARLFIDGQEIPHLYTQGTHFLSAGSHDLELRSQDGSPVSVRLRYYKKNPQGGR